MEASVTPEALPVEAPFPDCGHKDWTLGCPRCFWEMEVIARGNIKAQALDDQAQGAVLFCWHVVMLIKGMEDQCAVMVGRSLDLSQITLAKELQANLKHFANHLVQLIADPVRLSAALNESALVAQEMQKRVKGEAAPPAPVTPSSIQLTDLS